MSDHTEDFEELSDCREMGVFRRQRNRPITGTGRVAVAESEEIVKVRWWWGRNRRKLARWAAEMRRQDEQRRIRQSTPTAYVLDIVDNGEHGWKWLVWDYDPDDTRLMAGQVEGVLAPHGMKDGYATALDALTAGLGAIRNGGWTGDVVLREKVPSVGTDSPAKGV